MKRFKEFISEKLDLTSGTEEDAIRRAYKDFKNSDAEQFKGKSDEELSKMAVAAVKDARK